MTDLMCHPEDFDTWSKGLDTDSSSCLVRPPSGLPTTDAPASPPPLSSATHTANPEGPPILERLKEANAAGHSGIMRLAASLIQDLSKHRVLVDLLQPPSPQGGTRSQRRSGCVSCPNQGKNNHQSSFDYLPWTCVGKKKKKTEQSRGTIAENAKEK
jgi:hypothetical protein